MNAGRRREVIVLMATDATFAERFRLDPDAVAAEYDLDADDMAVLDSLRNDDDDTGTTKLNQRLSKSSLFFGGAAHALGHAESQPVSTGVAPHGLGPGDASEHVGTAEFGLLKCDAISGLLKCDGHASLQCNLVIEAHGAPAASSSATETDATVTSPLGGATEFGVLKCNGYAGLVKCNGVAGLLKCNGFAGVLKCNAHSVLLCNGHPGPDPTNAQAGLLCNLVTPTSGHGGAADGGDGGDGLRPIVVPPGGHAADGGDGGDGLRPIVVPPGGHAADGGDSGPDDASGTAPPLGLFPCNGIRPAPEVELPGE